MIFCFFISCSKYLVFFYKTFLKTGNSVCECYSLLATLLCIKISPFWKSNSFFRLECDVGGRVCLQGELGHAQGWGIGWEGVAWTAHEE